MSVFLKAYSYGSDARIFRIRKPIAEVGLDENGILTTEQAHEVFFSLERRGEKVIIFPKTKLTLSDKLVSTPQQLPNEGIVSAYEYNFHYIISSIKSESLALMELGYNETANINSTPLFFASYRFASSRLIAPLFKDISVTLGSSEADTLIVPLNKISSCHCSLTANDTSITVKPIHGNVKHRDNLIKDFKKIQGNDEIVLTPVDISISIRQA